MRFELLVGARAFWRRAQQDIARAKERVLVQAMTFEGDRTGLAVAAAIDASTARDRRVLVDEYSRAFVSDRWVFSPSARRDPAFRSEVRETEDMFKRLQGHGVGVVFTNPLGMLGTRFPARNHKKLLVMDGVAYVGGINFSDHNFAWDDMMVRCEDGAIADYLARDFDHTFAGRPTASEATFEDALFMSLSGASNDVMFARLVERIERAARRIDVFSPYLTFPFCEALAKAQRRGVRVTLFTCRENNKGTVHDYMLWAARHAGFAIRLWPGMSHLKAMLIDDQALVLGSSNFDFVSYHAQAELVAIVTDAPLLTAFRREIVARDTEAAQTSDAAGEMRGRLAFMMLKVAEGATRLSGARLRSEHQRRAS